MHTEHHRWHSPALDGKPMDILVYGHAGAKLFVFPTSMGTYYEWPDRRMPQVLGDHRVVVRHGCPSPRGPSPRTGPAWHDA